MPGEGVEPSRPTRGHPILSRARIASFATPACADSSAAAEVYDPGVFCSSGMPSGPFPRNASRNAFAAPSSKFGQIAMRPWP
jgi:hypothetical protein